MLEIHDMPLSPIRQGAAPRERLVPILACSLGALAALLLIFWIWGTLEAQRRAGLEHWANEAVFDHVRSAEQHLADRHWDRAIDHLEEALTIPRATDLAQARALLAQAKKAQCEGLLEAALTAIRQHELDQARSSLQDYLTHPLAAQPGRARRLRDELNKATSDEQAAALLERLSTPALAAFTKDGTPEAVDGIRHESLKEVYRETLQRNLVRERHRREEAEMRRFAQREAERQAKDEKVQRALAKRLLEEQRVQKERARQLDRIEATPVYRELTDYLALVRKQGAKFRAPVGDDDHRLLASLVGDPGKLSEADKAQLRETLARRLAGVKPQEGFARWKDDVELNVSSRRAVFKERFRAYQEFDKADRELFEKTVDRELDALLAEINRPTDDDFALGLRALLGK